MPPHKHVSLYPNDVKAFKHPSIRRRWIQNLVDALHACLLKGDLVRAYKAWAILIRCREVDWKSRWHWGLLLLSASSSSSDPSQTGFQSTQMSAFSHDDEGKEAERWLNALRVSAREEDKPSLLHALVLHLIKHDQYRRAYEQLETYLSSYPYLLSGPLHTYAGLLAFYLAQPPSMRIQGNLAAVPDSPEQSERAEGRARGRSTSSSPSPPPSTMDARPADISGMRTARGYFAKALVIDEKDEVAKQFIKLIDNPHSNEQESDDSADEKSDESMRGHGHGSADESGDDDLSADEHGYTGGDGKDDDNSEDVDYDDEKLEKIDDSDWSE